MQDSGFIPCENSICKVDPITWASWKDRLLAERMQARTAIVLGFLKENNNHWEECFWWLIAKNFGLKLNSEAFLSLARSISLNVLAKHKNQLQQLEAILFGQAGLLERNFVDDYPKLLQREYRLLKRKYGLKPIQIPLLFMRMRPSAFPSVRLAQLAALIHDKVHLFSLIRSSETLNEVREILDVTANDYWHYHYTFDEISVFKKKSLGMVMTGNIIINTIIPLVFAYGVYNSDDSFKARALEWMELCRAEKNSVTGGFEALGIAQNNAFDSQALLQLKNEYCNKKRCLECAIGNRILNSKVNSGQNDRPFY